MLFVASVRVVEFGTNGIVFQETIATESLIHAAVWRVVKTELVRAKQAAVTGVLLVPKAIQFLMIS